MVTYAVNALFRRLNEQLPFALLLLTTSLAVEIKVFPDISTITIRVGTYKLHINNYQSSIKIIPLSIPHHKIKQFYLFHDNKIQYIVEILHEIKAEEKFFILIFSIAFGDFRLKSFVFWHLTAAAAFAQLL